MYDLVTPIGMAGLLAWWIIAAVMILHDTAGPLPAPPAAPDIARGTTGPGVPWVAGQTSAR